VEDLQAEHFREDLYERLNVIPIVIPPLREHPEDIPALAHHFLRLFDRAGRIEGISPAALGALMAYAWPRNVRELRNVIERTVLLTTERVIEPHHLSLPNSPKARLQPSVQDASGFSIVLPDGCTTLAQIEAEVIRKAYAYTGGNVSQAAKRIGLARETFRRKLAGTAEGS